MSEYTIRATGNNLYSIDHLKDGNLTLDFVDNINHAQVLEFVAVRIMAGVTVVWEADE